MQYGLRDGVMKDFALSLGAVVGAVAACSASETETAETGDPRGQGGSAMATAGSATSATTATTSTTHSATTGTGGMVPCAEKPDLKACSDCCNEESAGGYAEWVKAAISACGCGDAMSPYPAECKV